MLGTPALSSSEVTPARRLNKWMREILNFIRYAHVMFLGACGNVVRPHSSYFKRVDCAHRGGEMLTHPKSLSRLMTEIFANGERAIAGVIARAITIARSTTMSCCILKVNSRENRGPFLLFKKTGIFIRNRVNLRSWVHNRNPWSHMHPLPATSQ